MTDAMGHDAIVRAMGSRDHEFHPELDVQTAGRHSLAPDFTLC